MSRGGPPGPPPRTFSLPIGRPVPDSPRDCSGGAFGSRVSEAPRTAHTAPGQQGRRDVGRGSWAILGRLMVAEFLPLTTRLVRELKTPALEILLRL